MINELYRLVGEIFENAQYVEWNIALIICKSQNDNANELFDSMQNMTMGQIAIRAKKSQCFTNHIIDELKYVLDKRNYVAHMFFKQNDIVKHYNNEPFLKNKIGELTNILARFQNLNKLLSEKS